MTHQRSSISSYHNHSDPEKETARRLANSLEPWRYIIPPGPILEVGAGTGHFTDYLAELFPNRNLDITDLSEEMLRFNRDRLGFQTRFSFDLLDVENDPLESQTYSMIGGNQIVQQLRRPAQTLESLAKSLKLDGVMLMAFPGEDSFGEWRDTCLNLGIPYTGIELPETEPLVIHLSMGPVQVDFYEDQSMFYYTGLQQFFEQIINGGMEAQKPGRKLTRREIELLEENWNQKKDGAIGMTYHNVFLAVKRIGE